MTDRTWSDVLEIDGAIDEINDYMETHGMTDGLPVIPPEPRLVEPAIDYLGYEPDHLIATVTPRGGPATIEKIVANCVMAGCKPVHIPVVIAALESITDPAWDLYGAQATTNPGGPQILVNGPCRDEVGVHYGAGALGPGFRANACIGRALRLILMNIGGARPGGLDASTHGSPLKYTLCYAEHEGASPWDPYHVEHGWPKDTNTVTTAFIQSIVNVYDNMSHDVDGQLQTLIGSMKIQGTNNFSAGGMGQVNVLLGPEFAAALARAGWTKESLRALIWERATIPLSEFSKELAVGIELKRKPIPDGIVRIASTPDDINLVVVGGPGRHTLLTFGSRGTSLTREIRFP